jgi:hypothetical protein
VFNLPEGIDNPFAPLRRVPDGLFFDAHGIMLNVALLSTKYLSLVNSSVRKINPVSAGKCMAVAVVCAGFLFYRPGARAYTLVGPCVVVIIYLHMPLPGI